MSITNKKSPYDVINGVATSRGEEQELIRIFFFQAEDGIRGRHVTGVQTCALPICCWFPPRRRPRRPPTLSRAKLRLRRPQSRSEERRVGKEWRCRWSPDH